MAARNPARPETAPDHRLERAGAERQIPATTGAGAPRRSAVGDLLRSLADDTGTLVRQEIRLAKLEAARTARRLAKDSAWIAAGVGVLAVGGLCLVLALALGLGVLLDSYWLGTLITGLVLVVLGLLMAWMGARDLRDGGLAPTGTVETLREDADWARAEVRDFKNHLTKE